MIRQTAVGMYQKKEHTLIGFSLLPELSCCLHRRLTPMLLEVIVRHDFTTDELVLEIRATVTT